MYIYIYTSIYVYILVPSQRATHNARFATQKPNFATQVRNAVKSKARYPHNAEKENATQLRNADADLEGSLIRNARKSVVFEGSATQQSQRPDGSPKRNPRASTWPPISHQPEPQRRVLFQNATTT
jgi:hypothetical protein